MKKFLVAFMAVLLILPILSNTSAQAASYFSKEQQTSEFTFEDIMELEPYISVKDGLFKFDSNSATKDGNNKELVKLQKNYLDDLNKEIKNGILKAESNLEIISLEPPATEGRFSILASCPGKNTAPAMHWWGHPVTLIIVMQIFSQQICRLLLPVMQEQEQ